MSQRRDRAGDDATATRRGTSLRLRSGGEGPEPLVIAWQGRRPRVRHDDPRLAPLTDQGKLIAAAVGLGSDVEGLRLVLASTVGDRYRVKVSDEEHGRAVASALRRE